MFYYCFHQLFHEGGRLASLLAMMISGGRIVFDRKFDATRWLDRVRQYSATITTCHGPMIEMICDQPQHPDDAQNPLRMVTAVPLPAAIAPHFQERFDVKASEVYGLTELCVLARTPSGEAPRPGSCGKPHGEMYDVRILNPDTDEQVPVNVAGEICVRTGLPWTSMLEYIEMPQETAKAWRNLWFHTGDIGYLDDEGELHFVDRMGDRIRRRAENVSSYEIEAAALSHPMVAECAAVGVVSGFSGDDDIKLYVVEARGAQLVPEDLLTHLVRNLPHYMVPRYIEVLAMLPREETNSKVQKKALRQRGVTPQTWDRTAAGVSVRALAEALESGCTPTNNVARPKTKGVAV